MYGQFGRCVAALGNRVKRYSASLAASVVLLVVAGVLAPAFLQPASTPAHATTQLSEGEEAIVTHLLKILPSISVLAAPAVRPWVPVEGIALGIGEPELELYRLDSADAAAMAFLAAPADDSGRFVDGSAAVWAIGRHLLVYRLARPHRDVEALLAAEFGPSLTDPQLLAPNGLPATGSGGLAG